MPDKAYLLEAQIIESVCKEQARATGNTQVAAKATWLATLWKIAVLVQIGPPSRAFCAFCNAIDLEQMLTDAKVKGPNYALVVAAVEYVTALGQLELQQSSDLATFNVAAKG